MDDRTGQHHARGTGEATSPADCSPEQLLSDFSVRVLALLGSASPSRAILLEALTVCYGVMDRSPFDEEIRQDPQGRDLLEAARCLGYLVLAGRRAEDGASNDGSEGGPSTETDRTDGTEGTEAALTGAEGHVSEDAAPLTPPEDDPSHGSTTATTPVPPPVVASEVLVEESPDEAPDDAVQGDSPSTGRSTVQRIDPADPLQEAVREQYRALLDDVDARLWLDSPADLLRLRPAEEPEIAPPGSASDYWRLAHVALLRLPDEQRVAWHGKLSAAARAAVGLRRAGDRTEPPRDEGIDDPDVLVPTLVDHSTPVLLSLTPTAKGKLPSDLPAELARAAGLQGGPAGWTGTEADRECRRRWAVRAHQALQLARLDPLLVLRWKGQNIGVTKAVGTFQQLLVDHLTSLSASQRVENPENRFRAEHRLDALIGSVLHTTPASEESWWWRWRAAGWSELAKSAERAGYVLHSHPERLQRAQLIALTGSGEEDNLTGRKGAPRALQWVLYALAGAQDGKGIGAVVIRPQ
ncbi:hypothetical protein ABZ348_29340 [Streptomyces sp. NPDC005963]|uniref:hypothetical protein n=1 Tax=Streptomyces sp. NPDC005963 TaxID=3156721 RepID=UPI0034021766